MGKALATQIRDLKTIAVPMEMVLPVTKGTKGKKVTQAQQDRKAL
jgi:hypothetical protein